ncbi:MAG: flagellar type III secretion system protein FlhB [Rubrivivax sp.]|nr:flagellar type III secretion system protein FlhB [Rubrivivax sp.]MDH5339940.1 flagellar type III secretion system protein FlhB [Rubrivivax sp.]
MADDAQDKRLPATEKKRRKAREDGQVARSRDLGHLTALGFGGLLLYALLGPLTQWLRAVMAESFTFDVQAVTDPTRMVDLLAAMGLKLLWLVLPLGAVMALVAMASGTLAGGWNFSLKAMQPKFSKLNPLAGLGRMVSKHQLTDALKASGLALVLFAIGALYVRHHLQDYSLLMMQPLPVGLAGAGELLRDGLLLVLLALGLFALVDVPLQRHLLSERLKMSHQEVKQEHKEAEGNTEVKGKIKARMRAIAQRRMMASVPLADIVIMNPTHYAVALKYDEGGAGAPRVVAKGADGIALRIRDLATDARVPVLQAPPLARALYAHCEIDQEIPAALFAAVAQVLAWVFQLRAAMAAGAALPEAPAALAVPFELDPLNRAPRPRGSA